MNLFPMRVLLPNADRLERCRVVFDGTRTTFWQWEGTPEPCAVLEVEGPPTSDASSGVVIHTIVGPDGEILFTEDAADCGCSHPLKSFTPHKPVRHFVTNHDA